ncbi:MULTISPECIES: TetR/AcrR family transcriptional regulator [Actinosynnema]|uniref:TetR/AcrR family transcriptional regulator n=1 Tax=Actinosynnema pretiosum subsp. pretiosum TaxID=103721 RepID=A0AA45L558_9PSEU|nr:TetR/AcrR family transcriptional regulator [Actinosynnema pretiosum]AXX33113.1 Transcriptional regulator, TetR family [Actinosynnema pretiosum subsp. pretiosum]MCP2094100.1 transcriptional regulator, TetR family [Actinosynnema pretiosum]QUF03040.1 TetR/AcrR family transcriptional regulator [Actinosynnema pretiosum subsp. pretiosum]
MAEQGRTLRKDARRNLEKLLGAAAEVFRERGLGAPLEEIAQRAGVSAGTLYNRFGTREALVDAVVPELVAGQLTSVVDAARALDDPWESFAAYLEGMCGLQASQPVFADVLTGRYGAAERLGELCHAQNLNAADIVERARASGALRADFAPSDVAVVFLCVARVVEATAGIADDVWRRLLAVLLDGLRADAAHPLPVPALTAAQLDAVTARASTRR